jgi:methylmalonyl-CoA/ethylmalonyl-CoA epimerase
MTAVLDHLAIGTPALTDGWELFGGVLGGTWVHGMDSPGYWWGQLEFAAGPKIELLTPTGGPDAAFLERFLAAHGAGPHHFNFMVSDIRATLARIRALGIEPVGVSLDHPAWQEAFLHPRDAHGIVIQVAQQAGSPPEGTLPEGTLPEGTPSARTPPAELPEPGPATSFGLIEHHVGDLAGATRLFTEVLDGRLEADGDDTAATAELAWPGGKRIRLVHEDGLPLGGLLHHVRFTRAGGTFSPQDRERAGLLAKRLGVTVELAG